MSKLLCSVVFFHNSAMICVIKINKTLLRIPLPPQYDSFDSLIREQNANVLVGAYEVILVQKTCQVPYPSPITVSMAEQIPTVP